LEDIGIDGSIILKWEDGRMWIVLIWLRIWTDGGIF
jgi:hypothetical protein